MNDMPVSGHCRCRDATTSPIDCPVHGAHLVQRSRLTNAEVAQLEAENQRLTALLHRWLLAASAMGGGPRAVLTQDTLDAVGMPDV